MLADHAFDRNFDVNALFIFSDTALRFAFVDKCIIGSIKELDAFLSDMTFLEEVVRL